MTEAYWGTTNIKVASAVASFGAKPRSLDPVTRTIKEDGSTQATFWFEAGAGAEARAEMERPWSEMKSDPESPIRYVRAALENRETFLGLLKRAVGAGDTKGRADFTHIRKRNLGTTKGNP